KNGKWDPAEVRSRLQKTATDLGATGKDNYYGYGLVNAYTAVNGLESAPTDNTPAEDDEPETGTDPETTPSIPVEPSMFISSLTGTTDSSIRGVNTFAWAVVTVKVVDSNGKPVSGATVNGIWSGPVTESVSGITAADGTVEFTSSRDKNPDGTVIFEITEVTCSGYVYDSSRNICSTVSMTF
ncbi:MAG: in, partial [Methanolobus sp.]|nr:in [Methanolobus sp.]